MEPPYEEAAQEHHLSRSTSVRPTDADGEMDQASAVYGTPPPSSHRPRAVRPACSLSIR